MIASQLRELGVDVPGAERAGAAMAAAGGMGARGSAWAAAWAARSRPRAARSASPSRSIRRSPASCKPGVPLFVAAREPGIPGPPIAATRITTDDLPATVVLSDANTMIEGRDLSSVNDVEIVARVAFGGTAVTPAAT